MAGDESGLEFSGEHGNPPFVPQDQERETVEYPEGIGVSHTKNEVTNKALAFDRALGKTSNDLVLEDQIDDHDRQSSDERASREDTPVFGVLPGCEDLQTDHNGLHLTLGQQSTGDNEFAISTDEAQDRDDDQDRAQQRQDELVKDLPVSSAVDMGGFINITGNGIHVALHEPNVHAHSAAGVDQNQTGVGVETHPGNDITNLLGNGK